MKFKAVLFFILASVSAGFAAPPFTLEPGVRLDTASVYCVTPISGGYRMYYSSATRDHGAAGVLSSTSTDGLVWTREAGIRISTGINSPDASSITAMGLYFDPAPPSGAAPYKAYYVGISSAGVYSILRATSTDGLAWEKTSAFNIQFNSGKGYITSPRPYFMGGSSVMLYYVRDSAGLNAPADYRVYRMFSTDKGGSFSDETQLLSDTTAYSIAVSTRTDGSLLMFITAPLQGGTTGAQIITAISQTGYIFYQPATVFSTNAATNILSGVEVVRATDTYSWRAYLTLTLGGEATSYIYSGVTLKPDVSGISPARVYINDPATAFTVSGEVFSAPAVSSVTISKGLVNLPVNSVIRNSDMSLTVTAVPTAAAIGSYDVTVTNADGSFGTLSNALSVDYRPGYVTVSDNPFRPLTGGSGVCNLNVTIFYSGNVTIKAYTVNGGFVKTIYNGPVGAGTTLYPWRGDTESGAIVASGLYLLQIKGPKTDIIQKVVVIK